MQYVSPPSMSSNYTINYVRGRRRKHHSCAIRPDKRGRCCNPPSWTARIRRKARTIHGCKWI